MNNTPTPRTDANDLGWQFHEQYDYFDSLSDDPIQWVDFARILERELTAAREKLKAVTEQRDRLAEAMTRIKNIYENPEKGCIPSSSDMYDEALQSLTTNEL